VRLTGILHVSLPSDIIQLFGAGSVPVIVAGSVLGVFELGERFASQRAKDALSRWLLTFDVQKAKPLPDGTQELFQRIFGERHFSLKCFVRSSAFSLGAMVFVGILVFLIDPEEALKMMKNIFVGHGLCYRFPDHMSCDQFYDWIKFILWLPWSIVIDYISLFKTRIILAVLTRMRRRSAVVAVAIIGIDFIVYKLIFGLGLIIMTLGILVIGQGWFFVDWSGLFSTESIMATMPIYWKVKDQLIFIFFWSGFAPSLWLWLYVFALFVTRALLRSEKIITGLRWALDVEKSPFRSIGAVAATLASIASVAIILVSVEVSRISAAS
jgi:hypothetical protein